jgi:dynein heavy chain
VYIFGGHGGVGYQRMSFNDLYSLDVETWEWTCLRQNTGSGINPNQPIMPQPEPRGGHVASILGT